MKPEPPIAAPGGLAESPIDQRAAPRLRTLFTIGKMGRGGREHVCLVRNMSDNGIGIEHSEELTVGEKLVIEMRGFAPTSAIVRWIDGAKAGLEFADQAGPILPGRPVELDDKALRSPRFAFDCGGVLQIDGERIAVRTIDLALGGAKLAVAFDGPSGATGQLVLADGRRVFKGWICWSSAGTAGFRFATPLSGRDLADIIAEGKDHDDAR